MRKSLIAILSIIAIVLGLKKFDEKRDELAVDDNAFDKLEPEQGITFSEPKESGPEKFHSIYKRWGNIRDIDWRLLKAIAVQESGENSQAIGPDPSYGLMQILCTGPDDECSNDLPAIPAFKFATKTVLLNDPDYNVEIASAILGWNIDNFGWPRGLSVYNSWQDRNSPENGPFTNQNYVNKVRARYNGFKLVLEPELGQKVFD